jgi:hypothetical protein
VARLSRPGSQSTTLVSVPLEVDSPPAPMAAVACHGNVNTRLQHISTLLQRALLRYGSAVCQCWTRHAVSAPKEQPTADTGTLVYWQTCLKEQRNYVLCLVQQRAVRGMFRAALLRALAANWRPGGS